MATGKTEYEEVGIYYEADRVVYVVDEDEDFEYDDSEVLLDTEVFIDPNDYDPNIPTRDLEEIYQEDQNLGIFTESPQYTQNNVDVGEITDDKSNLTPNLSYAQAIYSNTAIRQNLSNEATKKHRKKLVVTSKNLWEPLYSKFGSKLQLTSMYRSKSVNNAIGGATDSQHAKGEAMDLTLGSYNENITLYNYIKDNLIFDQLLWENLKPENPDNGPYWIHVSYKDDGKNRGEYFRMMNHSRSNTKKYIADINSRNVTLLAYNNPFTWG